MTTETEEKVAAVFRVYDVDGKNWLDRSDMMNALAELGVLQGGMTAKMLGDISGMDRSLQVKDKKFSMQELLVAYDKLTRYMSNSKAARKALPEEDHVQVTKSDEASLNQAFNNYCKYTVGQGHLSKQQQDAADLKMNSAQFSKFAWDLGVVEPHGPLPQAEVDIIFAKCKTPGTRRLTAPQFLRSVATLSSAFSVTPSEIVQVLGPQLKPRTGLVGPTPAPFVRKYKKEMAGSVNVHRASDTGATLNAALEKHELARAELLAPAPASSVPRELQGIDEYLAAARNPRQSVNGVLKLSPMPGDTAGLEPPPWLSAVLDRLHTAEVKVEALEKAKAPAAGVNPAQHKVLEEKIKDLEHKLKAYDPKGVQNGSSVEARFLADEGRLEEQERKLEELKGKIEKLRVQAMAPGAKGAAAGGGGGGEYTGGDAKIAALQQQIAACEDMAQRADKSVGGFQTSIRNLDQNVEKAEWKFQDVLQMLKTLHQMLKDLIAEKDKALIEAMQTTDQALAKMQSDVKEATAASQKAAAAAEEARETGVKVGDMEVVLTNLQKQHAELYVTVSNLQQATNKTSVDSEGLNGRLTEALDLVNNLNTRATAREDKAKADSDLLVALDDKVKTLSNAVADAHRDAKEVANSVERVANVGNAASAEALRALERKVTEMGAGSSAADKAAVEEMRVQVRILKDEVALVKSRGGGGGGGGSGGPGHSAAELEAFKEQMYEDMRELDGAIERVDKTVKAFGTTLGTLKSQVENVGRDVDNKLNGLPKVRDLKESENYLLERHSQLHEEVELAKKNVREMYKGVEENTEKVMVQFNKLATQYNGQATIFGQLQLQVQQMSSAATKIDERIDGRAQALEAGVGRHLQNTNEAIEQALKQLDARMNTIDTKMAEKVAGTETRALESDTQIRVALGQMDQHVSERFEMGDKVLMRLARQIDYLQKRMKEVIEDTSGPAPKIKISKKPLPPGVAPVASALTHARGAGREDEAAAANGDGVAPTPPAGEEPRRARRFRAEGAAPASGPNGAA